MLFLLYTLLAATILLGQILGENLGPSKLLRRDDSQTRALTAITVRSELERRSADFSLKHTWEHHYADHESLLRGDSSRFAKISTNFKLATLALEDIESHLKTIQCSESAILLEFVDGLALKQARREWDGLSKFLFISSHIGCNGDGERAPHMVTKVSYDTDGISAIFSVQRVGWKAAYRSMKVDFGMTSTEPGGQYSIHGIRSHDNLRRSLIRRQGNASSTVVYPSAPTATPSGESSVHNLDFSSTNPSILSLDGVNFGCKNCSFSGNIEITQGTFTINNTVTTNFNTTCRSVNMLSQSWNDVCQSAEEAYEFIEYGYFDVVTNSMGARMELDAATSLAVSRPFKGDIFTIALPGFQIPGIAAVGPQFTATLLGNIDIESNLNFTYGFDLKVPDASSINFNIGNLTNSSSHGFSNSKITAIPFAASSESVNMTLKAGIRAEILLGVNVLDGDGEIQAGMFLDLPSLSVYMSALGGVNARCDNLTSSNAVDGVLGNIFPKLLHIVPSASIDLGLELSAGFDFSKISVEIAKIAAEVLGDSAFSTSTTTTLAATTFSLPTACMSWNSEQTKFVAPTVTSTVTVCTGPTGTASGTGPGSSTGPGSGTGSGSKPGGDLQKLSLGTKLQGENPFARTTGFVCAVAIVLGFMFVFAAL